MKKRLFATMLLFTCILSLTSCSKDDGDWDAMKWEKNNYEEVLTPSFGKAIGVPKSGGTYIQIPFDMRSVIPAICGHSFFKYFYGCKVNVLIRHLGQ